MHVQGSTVSFVTSVTSHALFHFGLFLSFVIVILFVIEPLHYSVAPSCFCVTARELAFCFVFSLFLFLACGHVHLLHACPLQQHQPQ